MALSGFSYRDTFPFGPQLSTGVIPIIDPFDAQVNNVGSPIYIYLNANTIGNFWQNSGRTTPVAANNDPIGAWDDISGNARHFTQPTAGLRPLYKTSQDGTPGCKLDGVDDFLTRALAMTAGFTVYLVAHWTKNSFPGSGTDVDDMLTSGLGGGNALEMRSYNGFNTTATQLSQAVRGTSLYMDGVAVANPSVVTPANQSHCQSCIVSTLVSNLGHYIGKETGNNFYSPDGIKALIIYGGTHTAQQISQVHFWVKNSGGFNTI